MLTLYKSMVCSLAEICSYLCNLSKMSDIRELKEVQMLFTARILGCQNLDYWERLKKLSAITPMKMREIHNRLDDVDYSLMINKQ